ncbi:MAG: TetR/AcrR family transcriptional regulator [Myxococcota bacterium]
MASPGSEGAARPARAPRRGVAASRREAQRRDTREQLYALAIAEFRRVGTQNARVHDIARAAGVVPGTFYFHFPTKDHVVFEMWLRNAQRFIERLEALAPAGGEPGLAHFLRAVADAMIDVEEELAAPDLVRDSLGLLLRPPDGTSLDDDPIGRAIAGHLAAAAARGELRAGALPPDELAQILLTSAFGALAAAPDDPAERRRRLRRTLDFFAEALAPAR